MADLKRGYSPCKDEGESHDYDGDFYMPASAPAPQGFLGRPNPYMRDDER